MSDSTLSSSLSLSITNSFSSRGAITFLTLKDTESFCSNSFRSAFLPHLNNVCWYGLLKCISYKLFFSVFMFMSYPEVFLPPD